MGKQLIKYHLGEHCPDCGSWDLERVRRPFWARNILFFIATKSYWCRRCFTIITCYKKDDAGK